MKQILKKALYRIFKTIYIYQPEKYHIFSNLIKSVQTFTLTNKKGKEYKFNIFNNYDYYFFKNFYRKEKDTSEWILSIPEGSIFFDIGANIGIYTIMAALNFDNVKIISFEPVAKNYYALIKNISNLKPLDICAYCLTLTNHCNYKFLNQGGSILVNIFQRMKG